MKWMSITCTGSHIEYEQPCFICIIPTHGSCNIKMKTMRRPVPCTDTHYHVYSKTLYTAIQYPVYSNTVPCIQQYGTLYTAIRYPAYSNTVPCIQQYGTLHTAIRYPVYSNTVPCIQQYGTLHTAIQYPAYSNTVPCIQQNNTLYTAKQYLHTAIQYPIYTVPVYRVMCNTLYTLYTLIQCTIYNKT